jgi:hypothetical protein
LSSSLSESKASSYPNKLTTPFFGDGCRVGDACRAGDAGRAGDACRAGDAGRAKVRGTSFRPCLKNGFVLGGMVLVK